MVHLPENFRVFRTTLFLRTIMVRIWKTAQKYGWIVLNDLDMSALYDPEGSPQTLLSIQICKQEFAMPYLEYSKLLALCMPCSLLIVREREGSYVALIQPSTILTQLIPDAPSQLREHGSNVDVELIKSLRKHSIVKEAMLFNDKICKESDRTAVV